MSSRPACLGSSASPGFEPCAAYQRMVGVAQVRLYGEQALYEQRADLVPDLVRVVAGLAQVPSE